MQELTFKIIARIKSDFREKFGIPRQSGLVQNLRSTIRFEPEFRNADALRGLEGFSHLWIMWIFSENIRSTWSPTVRPPRLGGNKRMGVFATRSPFRPNPLGLSSVKLKKVEFTERNAPVITVLGADLMDGTPIYDIKPYIPFTDAHAGAKAGFVEANEWKTLEVVIPEAKLKEFSEEELVVLRKVLAQDPRPQYKKEDGDKVYGMTFGGKNVRFRVENGIIEVL